MASIYPKERSPFWFIRYRDPKTGRTVDCSTKLRRNDVDQTRQAKRLRAQWEEKELASPRVKTGEAWEAWVPDFLKASYSASPLTELRSTSIWAALRGYLKAKGILSARTLTREHCLNYITWRQSDGVFEQGLRKVRHNTALLELKFLSRIMREAVNRGLAGANPAAQLGIKRAKAKEKPEICDDEVAIIEAALISPDETRRPYNTAMQIAWKIALLQVVRLTETCIPLSRVNLEERTITFDIKGGREHTSLLHPELVQLFERLKAEKLTHSFEMPKWWSKRWGYFFKRHKLKHITFHCTRVTGVTRLRRQGVDERIAMEYVGHSSELVHRTYQRKRKDDQISAVNALSRNPSSKSRDSS
jgi:integrase